MKTNHKSLLLVVTFSVASVIGYVAWKNSAAGPSHASGRKVLFYQDSMHPWVKSDQPGKCTICAMDLTPICEGDKGFGLGDNVVALSSNSITVLNVQTAEVKLQPLGHTLRVAGILEANEMRKAILAAPAPGWIETMAVKHVGVEVKEGQTLLTFFSPEFTVRKRRYAVITRGASQSLMNGMTAQQDAPANPGHSHNAAMTPQAQEESANSQPAGNSYFNDLVASQSGVVTERNVFAGQYVAEGEKFLTIVDPSVLWFRFDVYERQLPWFEQGQKIEVAVSAVPGRTFSASVSVIEPSFNEATRTVKVRADVENPVTAANGHPHRLLRFGMYAEARVRAAIPNVLAVPRTAVLFPGGAAYAYVDKGDGAYERRRVKLGRQGDELWEVLEGLGEGDRVVTCGNVLIDAQAQFNQGDKAEKLADDAPAAASPEEPMPVQIAPPKKISGATNAQVSVHTTLSHRDRVYDRMALSEVLWEKRGTIIAEAEASRTASAQQDSKTKGTQTALRLVQAYRDSDATRMALSQKMQKTRRAAIAEASPAPAADPPSLAANQSRAFLPFLAEADGITQALAADNLDQFNRHAASLSGILQSLQRELGTGRLRDDLVQNILAAGNLHSAKDLAEARKQFLPFSTATVALAKQLKKDDPSFAGLKIYHCPMAPKPGLWVQAKAPLANPFYGAEMLRCGEEVK